MHIDEDDFAQSETRPRREDAQARLHMLHTRTAKDPCWLPKRLSIPTSEVPVETDRSNLWKTRLIAPCPTFCDAREEENRKHQPLEDLRNHIQPPPLTLDHCFTITITYLFLPYCTTSDNVFCGDSLDQTAPPRPVFPLDCGLVGCGLWAVELSVVLSGLLWASQILILLFMY